MISAKNKNEVEPVIKENVGLGLQLKSLVNVAEETSSSFKRPPGTAQKLGCGLKNCGLRQFLMFYVPSMTSKTKRFLLQDMLLCAASYIFLLNLFILITQLKYQMPNVFMT